MGVNASARMQGVRETVVGMTEWPATDPTPVADNRPDTAIFPYVQALNESGVTTYQSCSGHVHADGTRTDGHLWFDAPDVAVDRLVASDAITYVRRMHKAEQCWEVVFPGLSHGEAALERAMAAVIDATAGGDGDGE